MMTPEEMTKRIERLEQALVTERVSRERLASMLKELIASNRTRADSDYSELNRRLAAFEHPDGIPENVVLR
jgi:hypothetical protein